MSDRVFIPADPDQRRVLWRQWIHTDPPRGEPSQRTTTVARRVERPQQSTRSEPSSPAASDWLPEVIDAPAGVIHGLKTAIADCLVGGTLPIADRERLIARSIKLGLSRFEANLLIAAVQNRHREFQPSIAAPPVYRFPMGWLLLAFLAVEAAVGIVLFRLLFW